MAKRDILPTLRADRTGYVLGDGSIDGFDDRPDLSPRGRLILARMAERYMPEALSNVQRELLEEAARRPPQPEPRLVALTHNLDDLNEAYEAGLFGDLSDTEGAVIRDPSTHPDLADASYPLTIGQAAKATGASTVQLRRWAEARLIPSVRINAQLHFLGAGVLHAMILAKTEKYEVSALLRILRGDEAGERLVRLLGMTLASISAELKDDEVGRELAVASEALVRHSEEVREAAEAYSAKAEEPDLAAAASG